MVDRQALALIVRSVGPHLAFILFFVSGARAFVPLHAGPFEHVDDVWDGSLNLTVLVSVFNPQDHIATMHLGEEIVIEECTKASNMHHSSRTGRIPDPHFAGLWIVSAVALLSDLTDISIILINFIIDFFLVDGAAGGRSLLDQPHGWHSSISESKFAEEHFYLIIILN